MGDEYNSFNIDCEQLLRKMLVIDPHRRYNIKQVKQHRWLAFSPKMRQKDYGKPNIDAATLNIYKEKALQNMEKLGIDKKKTMNVRIFFQLCYFLKI